MTDDSSTGNWPASLRELAEIVGAANAVRLTEALGGLEKVYVAKQPTPVTRIARVIGIEGARRLAEVYGGSTIDIARGAQPVTVAPRILAANGSNAEVARRVGCTQRHVRRVRNRARRDDEPDLFGRS